MSFREWHQCSAQSFELHPGGQNDKHRFKGPPDLSPGVAEHLNDGARPVYWIRGF